MMNPGGVQQITTTSSSLARPDSLLIPSTSSHFFAPQPPTAVTSTMINSTASLLNTPTSVQTPILLTPNTMKSIEQSILQTLGEDTEENFLMESQQYSGNFVPPLPSSTNTITLINTWQGGQVSSDCVKADTEEEDVKMHDADELDKGQQLDSSNDQQNVISNKGGEVVMKGKKRSVGGGGGAGKRNSSGQAVSRKGSVGGASNNKKQSGGGMRSGAQRKGSKGSQNSSPGGEEDERKKIRRERNKLAAARCRKRRVDHTNKLLEETEGLEAKKRALQNQITDLQTQKEELEFLLEAHSCVKKVMKNEVLADLQNLQKVDVITTSSSAGGNHHHPVMKMKRPSSLNVISSNNNSSNNNNNNNNSHNSSSGGPPIAISTPSNGIPIAGLGFDSLCSDWGVNTPSGNGDDDRNGIVPTSDLVSRVHSPLVTPVMPFKRLHDL